MREEVMKEMAYTLERIKNDFYQTCAGAKANHCANMVVSINSRLTRTLGRVISEWDSCEDRYYPTRVEFSKAFIEHATDANILDVIKHEAAHAILVDRTGKSHGHDALFKAVCAEIGTTNDGCQTKVEKTVANAPMNRYEVYCEECGRDLGGFSRRCKTLDNIEFCRCEHCGGKVKVIKNW